MFDTKSIRNSESYALNRNSKLNRIQLIVQSKLVKMSDSNTKTSFFHSKQIIVLLTLTQALGLLPVTRNTKLQLQKSKFLFFHSLLIFTFFTIVYAMTIYIVLTESTQLKGISGSIKRSYFVIIYVLCVLAYIDQFFQSKNRIKILNDFFRAADLVSEIGSDIMGRFDELSFFFRIFYMFFGYGYLFIMDICLDQEAAKSLSYVHWVSFLIPISLGGCGMLWIHVLTVLQINSVRIMKKGFSDCIHMANGTIGLAPAKRHIICCQANDTFDKISQLYTICFDLFEDAKKKSVFIVMVILMKLFLNMTTMVSKHKNCKRLITHFLFCKIFFFKSYSFYLLIIDEEKWDSAQKVRFIHSVFRLLFEYFDLQFMCINYNNLQKEYQKVGLVIQKGFVVKIPKNFQRSVSEF